MSAATASRSIPSYLAWQVRRDVGHQFRVLEEAEDINAQMPAWVTDRIAEALNDRGKAVKDAKILVLGRRLQARRRRRARVARGEGHQPAASARSARSRSTTPTSTRSR